MKQSLIALLVIFLFIAGGASAARVYVNQDASNLPRHPRLLWLDEEELRNNIVKSSFWFHFNRAVIRQTENLLDLPVLEYNKTGRRLLAISRQALYRIFLCSYSYRITSDERFLTKAVREMVAVSNFEDWNPDHFLDVAEMATGVAIGYDWLYDKIPEHERTIIRKALVGKGIEPSLLTSYNDKWLTGTNNWNQVCNTGMLFAALAVAEDEPELSNRIIHRSVESISSGMKPYGPDGNYQEGYGYWHYGTSFNVLFIDAVEKIYGSDFGLSGMPGFMESTRYIQHMLGVKLDPFNYADADSEPRLNVANFWFAKKLKDHSLLWNERQQIKTRDILSNPDVDRFIPAILIWGSSINMDSVPRPSSLVFSGQGVTPVWIARTAWDDPKAVYVGLKAGSPSTSHAHMDIGSFVFETLGTRWAIDLGVNNYEKLEKQKLNIWDRTQNSDRWKVFRYNNQAHNTLTINGKHQLVSGHARIDKKIDRPGFCAAVSNLSTLYKDDVASVTRGVALIDSSYVRIQDEIKTDSRQATVQWRMVTKATPKIRNRKTIELGHNGEKLLVRFCGRRKVKPEIWPGQAQNSYEDTNEGVSIIGFEVKLPANTFAQLVVELVPESKKKKRERPITVLALWE